MKVYSWIGGDRPSDVGNAAKAKQDEGFQAIKMNATEELQMIDSYDKIDLVLERVAAIREACGKIFPLRDAFEARMFEKITSTKKPILAICRGMQVINVFLGGTLYQDIDTEYETSLAHRQTAPNTEPWHNILVLKENKLSTLIGGKSQMTGNSFHHQAVKALAKGLTCTAKAEDGIIEAYTSDDYPYLAAYQWHPERLSGFDQDNHTLFTDFIAACKK
jgi:putative glutamine amidotransferase